MALTALEELRKQLEKLRAGIGTDTAQLKTRGTDDSDAHKPIPYKPQPSPETPTRPETKKERPLPPPPPPNYEAMAAQCNAIYEAAMRRRWAKRGESGLYTIVFRKKWFWNSTSKRVECDIGIKQIAPSKGGDPKTFKPYFPSELVGAITFGQAEANIKAGTWFGE